MPPEGEQSGLRCVLPFETDDIEEDFALGAEIGMIWERLGYEDGEVTVLAEAGSAGYIGLLAKAARRSLSVSPGDGLLRVTFGRAGTWPAGPPEEPESAAEQPSQLVRADDLRALTRAAREYLRLMDAMPLSAEGERGADSVREALGRHDR